jgi:integrase
MKLEKKAHVVALAFTGKEPCIYWGERGFGCRVYASGRRTWVLGYRGFGTKRLITIGEFPNMSQSTAEDMAAVHRLQVAEGSDPATEKRLASKGATSQKPRSMGTRTVSELCDAYIALHARHKRSCREDERLIEKFIRPRWGKVRTISLTRQQVAMQHACLGEKTPIQANRVLAVLKTMMNKAPLWGFVPESHANPAMKVPMHKEHSRERFVSCEELPRLAKAIEAEPSPFVRAVFWIYLLTGARKSELLLARWSDVDAERMELRIPNPKQGKPHVYPLSVRAAELLNGLPRFQNNPFIFVGSKSGASVVNISRPWNRIRARANLRDVRLHDLRRSVGSWLAEAGFSLISIGKVLGHSSPRTTQIYARLSDRAARTALEAHSVKMLEVLRVEEDARRRDQQAAVQVKHSECELGTSS